MKTKIGLLSLGCPRNLVDSESILARLTLKRYPIVDIDKADVAIVNTCGFIEDAKRESIDAILDLVGLKKEGKLKKIIVYGCLSQRYQFELKNELPEVDAFVGRLSLNHQVNRFPLTARHFAYLKISEGCINNCSFCVIPKIKGKYASIDMDSIFKRVDAFNKEGLSELVIIGQDITGYGLDLYGKASLTALLKRVLKRIENIGWLRLLYLYPKRIDDELLYLIRDNPKLCKYIDLPIQHINNRILKLMRRDTQKEEILKLIEKMRKVIPDVGIRTSIIVGFPSESDKEFRELLDFIAEVRFERLGAFIYSREEGTAAYHFKEIIPQKVKVERFDRIMSIQQEISRRINQDFLGRFLEVLIEEKEDKHYLGRSQYDAPEVDGMVFVRTEKKLKPGDFVRVKITDTLEYDLVGEVQ